MAASPTLRCAAVVLALALLAAGCQRAPERHDARLLVFGTLVDITLYGLAPERARAVVADLEEHLQRWHRQWHPWEGDGLAAVNRQLAEDGEASVPEALRPLVRQALELARDSGHRFHPGLGALVRLWGFEDGSNLPQAPPAEDAVAQALEALGEPGTISLEDGTLTATRGTRLDLGAFAKGYALARLAERLAEQGVDNAMVNAGGDLVALGRPGDRLWRIGVRHPEAEGLLASVEIDGGEAVFTSGNYERSFSFEGRRYHHILDPASGSPARGLTSVTVLDEQPARADAAATALFVAGAEDWPAVAAGLGLSQVMVVLEDGTVAITPELAERVRFEVESAPRLRVRSLP